MPRLLLAFCNHMVHDLNKSESTSRVYTSKIKTLFQDDHCSLKTMASSDYLDTVKASAQNQRSNGYFACGLKSFQKFYSEWDGDVDSLPEVEVKEPRAAPRRSRIIKKERPDPPPTAPADEYSFETTASADPLCDTRVLDTGELDTASALRVSELRASEKVLRASSIALRASTFRAVCEVCGGSGVASGSLKPGEGEEEGEEEASPRPCEACATEHKELQLRHGVVVEFHSLLKSPELNGLRGTLLTHCNERGRWKVLMPDDEEKFLKAENLKALSVASMAPALRDPTAPAHWPAGVAVNTRGRHERLPVDWGEGWKTTSGGKLLKVYIGPTGKMVYTMRKVEEIVGSPLPILAQANVAVDGLGRQQAVQQICPLEMPNHWPRTAPIIVDTKRWVYWLPQGWGQGIKTTRNGGTLRCYVSPSGKLFYNRNDVGKACGAPLPDRADSALRRREAILNQVFVKRRRLRGKQGPQHYRELLAKQELPAPATALAAPPRSRYSHQVYGPLGASEEAPAPPVATPSVAPLKNNQLELQGEALAPEAGPEPPPAAAQKPSPTPRPAPAPIESLPSEREAMAQETRLEPQPGPAQEPGPAPGPAQSPTEKLAPQPEALAQEAKPEPSLAPAQEPAPGPFAHSTPTPSAMPVPTEQAPTFAATPASAPVREALAAESARPEPPAPMSGEKRKREALEGDENEEPEDDKSEEQDGTLRDEPDYIEYNEQEGSEIGEPEGAESEELADDAEI